VKPCPITSLMTSETQRWLREVASCVADHYLGQAEELLPVSFGWAFVSALPSHGSAVGSSPPVGVQIPPGIRNERIIEKMAAGFRGFPLTRVNKSFAGSQPACLIRPARWCRPEKYVEA
jgi:hypothetical protein